MNSLEVTKDLIRFDSISRSSNVAVSDYIANTLRTIGCETESLDYVDATGVTKRNIVGRLGNPGPGGLAYFGHSDVVPADDWYDDAHGPFDPIVQSDRLYGRGSCDMKGSIATILEAASRYTSEKLTRPLYIVITSDEEVGFHGAKHVSEKSTLYRELRDGGAVGIIGEPTELEVVIAHKGSRGMRIVSHGEAAHSSSSAGKNANLAMIPFLNEMVTIYRETERQPQWQNPAFDPPTLSWNIGINDGNTAINVKAPESVCTIYLRTMPGVDSDALIERTRAEAKAHGLDWTLFFSAEPFEIAEDATLVQDMLKLTGSPTPRRVCYGTDAAVFAELGNLVVCGPGDVAKAHTKDEWITLEQLERGVDFYSRAIDHYCIQ